MQDFEAAARNDQERNIVGELWYFLQSSKKWWLAPILIVIFMFGVLVFLSGTAAAPFIYTLF